MKKGHQKKNKQYMQVWGTKRQANCWGPHQRRNKKGTEHVNEKVITQREKKINKNKPKQRTEE